MTKEKISCLCVVALLVLSLPGTGTVAAAAAAAAVVEARFPDEATATDVPVIVVYRGYGFALKGDGGEFHMLRMHIVRVREIEPEVIRAIMEGDKSIEEIKDEIIAKGGAPFYRGHLQFSEGEGHYRLVNVTVTREQKMDNLSIHADVMHSLLQEGPGPLLNGSAGRVGNISVTVRDYYASGVRTGEGQLRMYGEEYRVLLELYTPPQDRGGPG